MEHNVPDSPTHTIKLLDNWDGQGDIVWMLAYKVGDEFYCWECGSEFGKPVIQHEGDQILGAWELNEENNTQNVSLHTNEVSAQKDEVITLNHSNVGPFVEYIVNEMNAKHGDILKGFILTAEKLDELFVAAKTISGDNNTKLQ
ncbi:hypothetical protein ACEUAI_20065 [Aeromonas veronii]